MFKFLTNKHFFSALKFAFKKLIAYEIEFEKGVKEGIKKESVLYALPLDSICDLLALDVVCDQNKLLSPTGPLLHSKQSRFICLKSPQYVVSEQKIKRQRTDNLEQILDSNLENLTIIPVSFIWGKHPDKQQSFFKIIFSPSWRTSGSIKKFFKVIFHGRNLVVKFQEPLDLTKLIDQQNTNEKNSLILSRYLRALFRKSKQAMLGPDISHRRTMVKSLVRNIHVRKEINQLSEGKRPKKKRLVKKAYRYANEICSDLNYPIVRTLIRGFTWFWNTRYEGIHINNLETIKELSKDNALIYLPCHRSHIDYCALSYILYQNGLMVPQVAAGNNLNLPIIGGILRGAGAVFMRRSFMKNILYSTVFFEYIRSLMMKGNSIEFFPEGGRSRSGFSLPSRPGLLSLILRSFASIKYKKVKIVPIYIGYEKILEGQSYLSELSGAKKKRESILDPIRVFKDFNNYLGNAYLNFGNPIDIESFLKVQTDDDFHIDSPLVKPEWLKPTTNILGEKIMRTINNSVAVSSTSLFSIGLLTDPVQTLDEESLRSRISLFLSLIERSDAYKEVWVTEKDVSKIIAKTEKLRFITHKLISSQKVYQPNSNEVATLSFYKSNISHLYMLYSLICESVRYVDSIQKRDMQDLIKMVYPIFSREYHLKIPKINEEEINKSLKVLTDMGILFIDSDSITKPDSNHIKFDEFLSISNICEPSLKRFYMALSVLWETSSISKEDLQLKCESLAKKLEKLEGWPYPEFSDTKKFQNFLDFMTNEKYIKEDPVNGNLTASKVTLKAKENYIGFFDNRFIDLVKSMN